MSAKRNHPIKKVISFTLTGAIVAGLAVMPMLSSLNGEQTGTASILCAQVETRDISARLLGGGKLTSEGTVNAQIPAQVKLTEYLVGNGDTVEAGEPIALVDKVSVMSAIASVQETLEELDDQIASAASSSSTTTVKALAGGTVKILYAQTGDQVQDVMLANGCLAVLSLDGLMAVKIQGEFDLSNGENVIFSFPDGASATGQVSSNLKGTLIATVTDSNYTPGDTVTLSTQSGTVLGTGELYILSPWNVTAYSGTVQQVNVTQGTTVTAGRSLFTLKEEGSSVQLQRLLDTRQEYETLMQELFTLYRTGTVDAPCAGIVSGVDSNGTYMLSSDDGTVTVHTLTGNQTLSGATLRLLSDVEIIDPEPTVETPTAPSPEAPTNPGTPTEPTLPEAPTEPDAPTTPTQPEESESPTDPEAPTNPTEPAIPDAPEGQSYFAYPARIEEILSGWMKVKQTAYGYQVTDLTDLPEVNVGTGDLTQEASYGSDLIDDTAFTAGDGVLIVVDMQGNVVLITKIALTSEDSKPDGGTGSGGTPGGSGGMSSGFSSFGGSSAQTEAETMYTLEYLSIASITSQSHMTISITVDELDISRVYIGQEATLTIDALGGEKFQATVTSISASGENSGGNSKFTVELTCEKSGQMLPGMYASAQLTLSTRTDTLSIPVAALEKSGKDTIVYTSCDTETGTLGNPVAVTTGQSDEEYAEILSGLSLGQTVYYSYYDTYQSGETEQPQPGGSGFSFRQMMGGK